jgi:hypothetical protein
MWIFANKDKFLGLNPKSCIVVQKHGSVRMLNFLEPVLKSISPFHLFTSYLFPKHPLAIHPGAQNFGAQNLFLFAGHQIIFEHDKIGGFAFF